MNCTLWRESAFGSRHDQRGGTTPDAAGRATAGNGRRCDLPQPNFLFIGELSRETGADPKTIRFYEREGLLSPPRHGRFRTYMSDDVKRLKDILVMRRMGIGIAQIRSLLASEGGFNAEGGAATANLLLTISKHCGRSRPS